MAATVSNDGFVAKDEDDVDLGHGEGPSRKRQRLRPVLACIDCKRRKVKCDRNLPCGNCIKRGKPDECQWDPQVTPLRTEYALSDDILALQQRLEQRIDSLEEQLREAKGGGGTGGSGARNTLEVCCPPSCACHLDTSKSRSRGSPLLAAEDLPLSQLIDERLGFKRGLFEPAAAAATILSNGFSRGSAGGSANDERDVVGLLDNATRGSRSCCAPSGNDATSTSLSLSSSTSSEPACTAATSAGCCSGNVCNGASASARSTNVTAELLGSLSASSIVLSSHDLQPPSNQSGSSSGAKQRLPILSHFSRDTFVELIDRGLPGRTACDALVEAYFEDFHWTCHTVHAPSFRREYESFWILHRAKQLHVIDPAWLALFMTTLALGLRCLSRKDLPRVLRQHDITEVEQWPEVFYECSQMALKLAHWTRKPQIRVLQTILLYLPYLDFSSEGPDTLIWIGAAFRIAHLLRLNRLAEDESAMPADDLALPTDPGVMKKQLAYQLWVGLSSADMMATVRGLQPLSGTSAAAHGALKYLLNCNDDELQQDLDPSTLEQDRITDVSFEMIKFRLASHQHHYMEACRTAGGSLNAFEVARLDKHLRVVIAGMAEPAIPVGGPPYPRSVAQHIRRYNMISSAVHYRLLRLHRPYMERGYTDADYYGSTSACVESALAILRANSRFREASTRTNWFFTLHCIEAVLVAFVDIFWKMDHNAPREGIERNKEHLVAALATFESAAFSFSPQVEQLARLGKSLVPKLQQEEHNRSMVAPPHREPMSEIFKRTAFSLCAPAAGSAGSGSGVNNINATSGATVYTSSEGTGTSPDAATPFQTQAANTTSVSSNPPPSQHQQQQAQYQLHGQQQQQHYSNINNPAQGVFLQPPSPLPPTQQPSMMTYQQQQQQNVPTAATVGNDPWMSLFSAPSATLPGSTTDFQMLTDVFGDFDFTFALEGQNFT